MSKGNFNEVQFVMDTPAEDDTLEAEYDRLSDDVKRQIDEATITQEPNAGPVSVDMTIGQDYNDENLLDGMTHHPNMTIQTGVHAELTQDIDKYAKDIAGYIEQLDAITNEDGSYSDPRKADLLVHQIKTAQAGAEATRRRGLARLDAAEELRQSEEARALEDLNLSIEGSKLRDLNERRRKAGLPKVDRLPG